MLLQFRLSSRARCARDRDMDTGPPPYLIGTLVVQPRFTFFLSSRVIRIRSIAW